MGGGSKTFYSFEENKFATKNNFYFNKMKSIKDTLIRVEEEEDFIRVEDIILITKGDKRIEFEDIRNCSKPFRNAI